MPKYRFHYRLTKKKKKGIKSKSSQKLKDNNVHVLHFQLFRYCYFHPTIQQQLAIHTLYTIQEHIQTHTQNTQNQLKKIPYTLCLNDVYFCCVLWKVRLCALLLCLIYTQKGRQSSEEAVLSVLMTLTAMVQRVMYTYFALHSLKPWYLP